MPADPAAVKELFLAAAGIADPAARADLLQERAGADADLLARVRALLAADDRARDDAATVDVPSESTGDYPGETDGAGAVIGGKYTLVEPIGEGGMGSVWRAKQSEPVKRFVAVKFIKAGMDSRSVLARFEAERQALALMDHPNIAKVLDGGVHAGRPYFVMELVKGVPITDFCDARRLTPKERLELFVPVCQAIQHAHQKGVIHRDVKPSNVLIALYDDRPVPKVIDFGVAKATGAALTEKTIDTGFGGLVGTPQYMSPEQATFNNLDIDTRSDVYALGVLLYELLTGTPPFSKQDLEKRGLLEILRVIREEEPPRPSTKLSTADALPSLSASRGTEPKKLTGLLRNELDWIVMRALEKDRTRRYETANGFAADVNRYLSGEAVQAHPPSTGYRLKKFVRRNRVQVIAACVVLFALLAGIAGTTLGLIEAKRQEFFAVEAQKAEAERAEGERVAKLDAQTNEKLAVAATAAEKAAKLDADARWQEAERNLEFAKKGNNILGSVFRGLNPKTNYATVAELRNALRDNLVKAVKELDGSAIGDPLVVAAMQYTLGESLVALGEAKLAIAVLDKSLATYKERLGNNHRPTIAVMSVLALCYLDSGMTQKALPLLQQTLALSTTVHGPDDPNTLGAMSALAFGYHLAGDLSKALPLLEQTLARMKAHLDPENPYTLAAMSNLAMVYTEAMKYDQALPLIEQSLALLKAKNGPNHPYTLAAMNNLGEGYRNAGRFDKALPLLIQTLALSQANLGPDHPGTFTAMNNLAATYWSQNELSKSVPLFEELLQLQEKKFGRNHQRTLNTMANLGQNYTDAGRVAEAVSLLEEAYRASKKFPTTHRYAGTALFTAYAKAGKPAAVLKLLDELLADARTSLPKDSPQLARELTLLGSPLLEAGGFTEVEPLLRECLAIREKTQPDAWTTFNTHSMLGGALLGQKKYGEAEPLLVKGYEGMKAREKSIPPQGSTRIPEALDRLIELYTATNKPAEAKKYRDLRAAYPTPKEPAPPPRAVR